MRNDVSLNDLRRVRTDILAKLAGVPGLKGVGIGTGGCVQILALNEEAERRIRRLVPSPWEGVETIITVTGPITKARK